MNADPRPGDDYVRSYPWTWERGFASAPPRAYEESARVLRRAGYRVRGALPPGAAAQPERFDGRFTAVRDVSVNAGRRRVGKIALALGALLTLVLLVLIAEDIATERNVISAPLLFAVVLGGFGMERLRDPEGRIRKLIEVRVTGGPDGQARVAVQGGAGPAFGDDWVEQWAAEQDFAAEEAALAASGPPATTEAPR